MISANLGFELMVFFQRHDGVDVKKCLQWSGVLLTITMLLAYANPTMAVEQDVLTTIEEIVVTARKREESLQTVPISMNVFSASDLENMSVSTLKDAAQFSPNLVFNDDGQMGSMAPVIIIRGIGQAESRDIFFDPGVGIYVDGVFVGRPIGLDMDLLDIERMEVLRGPQGTLYGKNTVGGAINIITVRPADEFGGSVDVTIGRFDRLDGKATLNLPLIPGKVHAKFSGSSRNADGIGKRLDFATGNKIGEMGDTNRISGRAVIDWLASESLNVQWVVSAAKVDELSEARRVVAYNDAVPIGGLLNRFVDIPHGSTWLNGLGWYDSYSDGSNISYLNSWDTALTLSWGIGDLSLKSITSYKDYDVKAHFDPDGESNDLIDSKNDWNLKQFSQEFLLSGQSFNQRLEWVAGVFYFTEKIDVVADTIVLDPLWYNIGLDLGFLRLIGTETDSYAAYFQGSYALTEATSLTAGLRYTHEDKSLSRQQIRYHTGVEFVPLGSRDADFQAFSPRIGLDHQWNPELMTYLSAAQGFKSGGINGRSVTDSDFLPFDPEKVWTYEAGIKSTWFKQQLAFNAALFFSDYTDIQFQVVTSDPAAPQPMSIIDNAGDAEIKGFEAELKALLKEGLTVTASAGYTDAKYTKLEPGVPITTSSRFPGVPEKMYALAAEYTVPIQDLGMLTGRVDWNGRSKVYLNAQNTPQLAQDGYGLVNARLNFATDSGNWVFSAFVTNLTNKKYIQGGTDFLSGLGFAEATMSRPREWGASIRYIF